MEVRSAVDQCLPQMFGIFAVGEHFSVAFLVFTNISRVLRGAVKDLGL